MNGEFKGFSQPADDKKFNLYIKNKEIDKIIKEYKKLKKYKKVFFFSNRETIWTRYSNR